MLKRYPLLVAIALLVSMTLASCKGSISLFGNLTSMIITLVLLWSTLHINRT